MKPQMAVECPFLGLSKQIPAKVKIDLSFADCYGLQVRLVVSFTAWQIYPLEYCN
jgi:hypothetical protein